MVAVSALAVVSAVLMPALPVHAGEGDAGAVATTTPDAPAPDTPTAGSQLRLDVRIASVDGLDTAWAQVGTGRRPPLLMLNGTGSPMSEWDPALLAELAGSGRRVIVYDYPGLGQSAPLPGRLDFDRLADHAAGLLSALRVDRVDVMGWSMGGFVAQRLMVRHPDVLRRVILAATNAGGRSTVLGPRWVQQADSDPHATTSTYVRTNYPPGGRADGWAFVARLRDAQRSGAYPPSIVPARIYRAMVAAEDPWLDSDANTEQLAAVAAPVLVVTGARDVITPPANSRTLATLIPDSRLLLWPRAGHSFLFQEPGPVARAIAEFLD